ncbi:metallophosphoesterase family protein [Bdellovibrio sp. HCB337]|uniref:metallophosphoesterase family protein n=1 Tax=Bdellovibrio sp. HCB337 TaxID=3394358 RepID=UPI0039A6E7BD
MKHALMTLLALSLVSCADFKDSPFTDELHHTGSDLNLRQQSRLFSISPSEETGIRFALMTDSHHNYNDLGTVVSNINRRSDLNFAVHTGDLTDSGYNFEYDAFIQKFSALNIPSFVVIGNHDAIGKGRKIYKNFFGDFNYSFVYRGYHFIFFNNNRMEFLEEGWSLDWLTSELQKNPTLPKIVFQHINFENADAFTSEMSAQMKSLYESHNVEWVINGHRHVYELSLNNGVHYLQVPRVEDARYLVLSLQHGSFELQSCQGASCENIYEGLHSY